jgi:nucleoporin SEH1
MAPGQSWQNGRFVSISRYLRQFIVTIHVGQAHDAAVTKLSWAHPEFGSVLASSSFDRTVKIWEEIPADNTDQPQANGGSAVASGPGTRWTERAVLADAKGSVRAVEFAPHQFGLKLVRASYRPSPLRLLTGFL